MKSKGYRGPYLFGLGLGVALLLGLGVGGWSLLGAGIASAAEKPIEALRALPAGTHIIGTINGRLTGAVKSIEIDDRDDDPGSSGTPGLVDANYGRTATHHLNLPHDDDVDCGASEDDQDCPVTTVGAYGDWDDIDSAGANLTPGLYPNHKAVDGIGNSDDSIFSPDSCITSGSALGKQDITESYFANNDQYFYFGQARRENNGNSQFYWLFTNNEPTVKDVANNCHQQLNFNFVEGDVRVRIGFPSSPNSSQPLVSDLSFHQYNDSTASGDLPAADGVNDPLLNGSRWTPNTGAVVNYALNTTCIAPPSSGTNSGLGSKACATQVDLVEFAEGAIDLSSLLGGSICGKQLYITIITRPSESATSDLKDLLGPIEYSFGGITVLGTLTPSCNLSIGFSATAEGVDGSDISLDSGVAWAWDFTPNTSPDQPTTRTGSVNALTANAGVAHTATVTATFQGCSDTKTTNPVTPYTPIAVAPTMAGSCDATGTWTYNATPSGGTLTQTCAWTFTDTNTSRTHSPLDSGDPSGSGSTNRGNAQVDTISGSVTCTETGRADALTCDASGNASADVYAPILVSIAPTVSGLACTVPGTPGGTNDGLASGITYNATATGGAGPLDYAWTVNGPNEGSCADGVGDTDCVIDVPTTTFCSLTALYVTVDDGPNACTAATSETENVTKQTSMSASNN